MPPDWIALIASFAYVFAAIGIAGGLRKWRGYSVEFTRKFIHITVGMWAYGAALVLPFHLIGGAPHDEEVEEQDIGIVRALLKPT